MRQHRFWRASAAVLALVALPCQGTLVLAGTTGGLSGSVVEAGTRTPIANAKVSAVSPSQVASTASDASGHFTLLNLAPDTYTVSIEKPGYEGATLNGVTVQADQTQTLGLSAQKSLKEIGRVAARSSSDLVRPGVTTDIYTVNPAQAAAATALGGGGAQNSSYSAVATVPGLIVPQGQAGWNQAVYIRGALFNTTGYEYDGIPVNRAFDNYAAHTASNLGQQQLQVYTGGGPASVASGGVSGFINDVIKTGTYPGFANLTTGLGSTIFYHGTSFEFGGATPDRNLSYYVGLSGYNQAFRYGDNFNSAANVGLSQAQLSVPGSGAFTGFGIGPIHSFTGQATTAVCDAAGNTPAAVLAAPHAASPGCFATYNAFLVNEASDISDREALVNVHLGIPHKNGLKDDVQFLASNASLTTTFYGSANDLGPGLGRYVLANTGAPAAPGNVPHYIDAKVYDAPFGTPVANLPVTNYYQPGQPANTAVGATLDPNMRDSLVNQAGIFKLQYTHNFSSSAYARAFLYTFYSSWLQDGPVNAWAAADGSNIGTQIVAYNYELPTHTYGAEVQFANQLSPAHLLEFTYNFTGANVVRFNNTGYLAGTSPANLVSHDGTGAYRCYSKTTFDEAPCIAGATRITAAAAATPGFGGFPIPTAGSAAASAGAQWIATWDGDADGTFNTVGPRFNSFALTDHWKPGDKLTLDIGARFNSFGYKLSNTKTAANDFYTQQARQFACYDPLTDIVLSQPIGPTIALPPGPILAAGPCAKYPVGGALHQFVHPDGTVQAGVGSTLFTDVSPNSYTLQDISPRLSVGYEVSRDTVLRASVGRYTAPPVTSAVQYNRLAGTAATKLLVPSFIPIGYFSPFHPLPEQSALNADFSLEQHFPHSDVSLKLTPFYGVTHNWVQQQLIGQNFATNIPVGTQTNTGLEVALSKGDFARNGVSGQIAYTYTDSKVKYQKLNGIANSQIDNINTAIGAFNALTKSGGGAPCYANTNVAVAGTPDPACGATSIANAYYNDAPQALLDPNGSYTPTLVSYTTTGVSDPSTTGAFTFAHNIVAILNYRHNRFAVTPSAQFESGTKYGAPTAVVGLDPRVCAANSAASNIATAPNPLQPDYTSCAGTTALTPSGYLFVPNPATGRFDGIGQYTAPNLLTFNLNLAFDVSKSVKANLLLANLYHNCFGGSATPWSGAYAPSREICGYTPNPYYPGAGFYNGSGPGDKVANGVAALPALSYPYGPAISQNFTAGSSLPTPFNAYFTLSVKL